MAVAEGPLPRQGLAGKIGHAHICARGHPHVSGCRDSRGGRPSGRGREAQPEGYTAFTTVPRGAYVWTCNAMNSSCMLLNLTEVDSSSVVFRSGFLCFGSCFREPAVSSRALPCIHAPSLFIPLAGDGPLRSFPSRPLWVCRSGGSGVCTLAVGTGHILTGVPWVTLARCSPATPDGGPAVCSSAVAPGALGLRLSVLFPV